MRALVPWTRHVFDESNYFPHGNMCRYEESLEGFQRAVKLLEEAGAHALQIAQAEHQMGVALERLGQVPTKVSFFCICERQPHRKK